MADNSQKYNYLAKNTLLFAISSFASKILVFLLVPFYTSVLSTEDYGTADFITITATLLIYVLTINICDAVLRFAIDRKQDREKCLKYGLIIWLKSCIALAGLLVLCFFIKLFDIEGYCYIYIFAYYFVTALYQILSNYLRAIDRVAAVAISGIITTVVMVGLNILLLIVFKWGIMGYLLSMVLGTLASCIYSLYAMRDRLKALIECKSDKEIFRQMRSYSMPLVFNNVGWWMNTSIDKYFIIGLINRGANGIYAVAQKIPTVMSMLHLIFSQAWNLSAIKEFDKDDSDGFFSKTYGCYNAFLVMVCSGLVLINIPLAKVLFRKEFFAAWSFSSVLLISIVFNSLGGFLGSVFSAVKDTKIYAVSTVIAAAVNCLLNAILIPLIGLMGAAVATVVSFFVIWLIRLLCTRKYITWKHNFSKDIIAYLLLIIQVTAEHLFSFHYIVQIAVFVILFAMYAKLLIPLAVMTLKKLMKHKN